MTAASATARIGMILLLACVRLPAAPILYESFESYNLGALDANLSGGENQSTNGGPGNPWWGPFPANLAVVGPENGIVPHSGSQMVRGLAAFNEEQEFLNIAHRFNGGNSYAGDLLLDWWFYDSVGGGAGANQFEDYLSLALFSGVPAGADYTFANSPGVPTQQLSLGGTDQQGGAFDATRYQAEVFGATNGYDPGAPGWFNTAATRSVGWHHARIIVAPPGTNGLAAVSFFIDDLVQPTLAGTTTTSNGFNCIFASADNGGVTAYYDDILFYASPPPIPTLGIAEIGATQVLTFPTPWILQTATELGGAANFTDLTNAVSPYTNSTPEAQRFFRLRY